MTQLIHCLDVCEQLNADNLDRMLARLRTSPVLERVYIGSSFCCRYLFQAAAEVFVSLLNACTECGLPVTLVLPIPSQRFQAELDHLLADFTSEFADTIDEITCNDYGLLAFCAQEFPQRIGVGRLLSKDLREPREMHFSQIVTQPSNLTRDWERFAPAKRIASIELDPTHRVQDVAALPQGVEPALHMDWCYITTGKICEMAAVGKEARAKFRPSDVCTGECQRAAVYYCGDTGYDYWKHGATSYFYQPNALLIGTKRYRVLENPLLTELFVPGAEYAASFGRADEGSLTTASPSASPVRDDEARHPEQRSASLSASSKDPLQNASRSDAPFSGEVPR